MSQLIRECVMTSEHCIRESRFDRCLPHFPLQNPNDYITVPEDAIQFELVPELRPSGCYQEIVTAMDVFLRYLFAYSTSNQDAKKIAKIIYNIMKSTPTHQSLSSQIKVQPLCLT